MKRASAAEFQRNFGEYQHEAQHAPVEITRHGRRELVLMSAAHYDWITAKRQRSFRTKDAPDFIVEAVKKAKMHPRHNHLNKLMK